MPSIKIIIFPGKLLFLKDTQKLTAYENKGEDLFQMAYKKNEAVIFIKHQEKINPTTLWVFADDVDAIYKEFVAAGVSISEPIETKPWRIRQFTIEDLDGNRFTFHHDV